MKAGLSHQQYIGNRDSIKSKSLYWKRGMKVEGEEKLFFRKVLLPSPIFSLTSVMTGTTTGSRPPLRKRICGEEQFQVNDRYTRDAEPRRGFRMIDKALGILKQMNKLLLKHEALGNHVRAVMTGLRSPSSSTSTTTTPSPPRS